VERLLSLPIVIPLLSAALCLILPKTQRAQRTTSIAGLVAQVVAGLALFDAVRSEGILVEQAGNWPAPFGISLVADLLSSVLVLLAAVAGLAVVLYSGPCVDDHRVRAYYYPLLQFLLLGVQGSFLTGDLFNLYVCFEVMLMSSFVLLTLGRGQRQIEGGVKYVILNLLASALFLVAAGLLYGTVGTLNLADLSVRIASFEDRAVLTSLSMLLLVAFGLKAALFPFAFWLPAAYHTPPYAVSAIFAGLMTKVGVYALLRTFTLLFVDREPFVQDVLATLACASIAVGGLGAAIEHDLRRIFSFQIIASVGFLVLGLALGGPLALAAVVFYLVQDVVLKTNLFLLGGVADRLRGGSQLSDLGGFWRFHPFLTLCFLLALLTVAGVPPLSGFWPKLALMQSALGGGQVYGVVAVALGALLSLFAAVRVFAEGLWRDSHREPPPEDERLQREHAARWMLLPAVGLSGLLVLMTLSAGPLFGFAEQAAAQLLDPSQYVQAVLGEGH
jgi:multicomponent Na+:H+ antiporter subunit D